MNVNAQLNSDSGHALASREVDGPIEGAVYRISREPIAARTPFLRRPLTHVNVFDHRIRTPVALVGLLDFAFALGASWLVQSVQVPPVSPSLMTAQSVLVAVACVVAALAMGLYASTMRGRLSELALRVGVATGLLMPIGIILVDAVVPAPLITLDGLLITCALLWAYITGSRHLVLALLNNRAFRRRVLVIGTGREARRIPQRLRRSADRVGFEVVAFAGFGEPDLVSALVNVPCIDLRETSLLEFCREARVDEIVIAQDDRRAGRSAQLPIPALLDCKMSGIETTELPSFFERECGRIDLDVLRPSWLLFSPDYHRPVRRGVKRLFDLSASLLLLSLSWPLMLLTIIAIRIEDGLKAPVFYRQTRVGLGGREYDVLKFRSMREDAERGGARFAEEDDPRITRVGRIIRRTRIDELPQLLNVLRGEMAFVGPRPERPCWVEAFNREVPLYAERHRVKPGLTGWAQLNYAYGSDSEDARRKLEYDLYYVKNTSLLLDLLVLIRTVEVVLTGKGAR